MLEETPEIADTPLQQVIQNVKALKENTPGTGPQCDRMLELLSNPANINRVDTRRMSSYVQVYLRKIGREKSFAVIGDGTEILRLPKGIGRSWDFDVFQFESAPLAEVTSHILLKTGLLGQLPCVSHPRYHITTGLDQDEVSFDIRMTAFVEAIEAKYEDVAYHNSYHAADVVHTTWAMMSCCTKALPPHE